VEGAWRRALTAAKNTDDIIGEVASAGQEGGGRGRHRRGRWRGAGWCEKIVEGPRGTGR
jgi:hypothetical protein